MPTGLEIDQLDATRALSVETGRLAKAVDRLCDILEKIEGAANLGEARQNG